MKYLAIVSYDGTAYAGFQRQTNARNTVQETIEKAFKNMTAMEIKIQSAGRTDKGVHAKGQVFHFESDLPIPVEKWLDGINYRLPLDIRIIKIKRVKDDFHARHSAKGKIYSYVIAKKPSSAFTKNYEVYAQIDIERIKEAIPLLIGTHDFKGFSEFVEGKNTIRTIKSISIKETSKHYTFTFHGISFLKYMVRSIMGTLIEIGENKKQASVINEIFETGNRALAGKTAEARGLFLVKIIY